MTPASHDGGQQERWDAPEIELHGLLLKAQADIDAMLRDSINTPGVVDVLSPHGPHQSSTRVHYHQER